MSIPISQFIPHPLSPLVSICLFSTSVSLFLPCKPVHLYHFSRFHIYALIYNICFSLCDLLHSVWQSLGPSASLQMTRFLSVLGLTFHCIYVPHLLYPFVCQWELRLLPWPVIVTSAAMNIGVHVSFWIIPYCSYLLKSSIPCHVALSILPDLEMHMASIGKTRRDQLAKQLHKVSLPSSTVHSLGLASQAPRTSLSAGWDRNSTSDKC